MNPSDPRLPAALHSAISKIRTTAAAAADRVEMSLGINASAAVTNRERQAFAGAQIELRRRQHDFLQTFGTELQRLISDELLPRHDTSRQLANTDWMSLSLVQDSEVDDKVSADRLAQAIAHDCEWELRDLASYMSSLLRSSRGEGSDRDPLRPELIGKALHKSIVSVTSEKPIQLLLSREIGAAMAQAMKVCYADILADLRARGVQPLGLSVKTVEGPGNDVPRNTTGYTGHSEFNLSNGPGETLGLPSTSNATGLTIPSPLASHPPGQSPRRSGAAWAHTANAGLGQRANTSAAAEAQLMTLIRRLAVLASTPTEMAGHANAGEHVGGSAGVGSMPAPGAFGASHPSSAGHDDLFLSAAGAPRTAGSTGFARTRPGDDVDAPTGDAAASASGRPAGPPGLMAVNLIREHRDELRQASTGTLDHMVIDVVGSLFDQILSDPKVPPQMARQIARLQLPVLRVALGDIGFFSYRRHPVRRFVNRIASLACAFDEFDDGPGQRFLTLVRELVQEIVQGDFDQMDLYESKLDALEAFIAQQTGEDVEQRGPTTSLLEGKESQLRLQQRYMQQLRGALASLDLQEFMRDFLSQVWSQAMLQTTIGEGADSVQAQRFRQTARNLVMSVQPKGTPVQRKNFLMQLPTLMKDLNDGLARIGWPETAKRAFFAQLLPAHAESLKGRPQTELEHNLLVKQLEGIFTASVPRADDVSRIDALPVLTDVVAPARFTPAEAEQIGLVEESLVDWSATVQEPPADDELAPAGELPPDGSLDIDQDLAMTPNEPPEPTHGAGLMEHLKLGFAYEMLLKDQWQKVRMSYVSPGRAFFVFTHGHRHQETISMTARMLARMCESERLRSYERATLVERATSHARR